MSQKLTFYFPSIEIKTMPKRSVFRTKKYVNPKKREMQIFRRLNINENLSWKPHMTNIFS